MKTAPQLVAAAIDLERQIADLTVRLKEVEKDLISYAKLDTENHTPTAKKGWSWIAKDTDGNIGRVTVAGRSIKEGIDLESDLTNKVREIVPQGIFPELFKIATYYKLTDNFRTRAEQLLGRPTATKLVKIVTSGGKTSVSYETAQKEAA